MAVSRTGKWLVLLLAAVIIAALMLWPRATALSKELPLTFVDGSRATLGDYRGRPLLLDFWSVDCPQCLRDMAKWAELLPTLRERDVQLISINIPQDPPPLAIARAKALAAGWPMALDPRGEIAAAVGGIGVTPTLILVDGQGTIIERRHGGLDPRWLLNRLSAL